MNALNLPCAAYEVIEEEADGDDGRAEEPVFQND